MLRPDYLSTNPSFSGPDFDSLCRSLSEQTGQLEDNQAWPGGQFQQLAETGVLGWVIPCEWGGSDISAEELTFGYTNLAAACLTTTFVLTQRNGACLRIAGSTNEKLKADLLPQLCTADVFATVGISHLTTSRQHWRKPSIEVVATGDSLVFNGSVPWVTGARQADYIVTGGTCADGQQVLAAIPTGADGVVVQEPPRLLALNASQTGSVTLQNVSIPSQYVIAGPVEHVMKQGKGGGAGSLTTSALAVGTAEGALTKLQQEAEQRPDLQEICQPLMREYHLLMIDLHAAARGETVTDAATPTAETIRQRANSLVLRSTQAYLAASKGAGFVAGHPAERAIREAMFFLVWSCPQPVLSAALREFACAVEV